MLKKILKISLGVSSSLFILSLLAGIIYLGFLYNIILGTIAIFLTLTTILNLVYLIVEEKEQNEVQDLTGDNTFVNDNDL